MSDNDYERNLSDVQGAISEVETVMTNMVDPEDEATVQEALDKLYEVEDRLSKKGGDDG